MRYLHVTPAQCRAGLPAWSNQVRRSGDPDSRSARTRLRTQAISEVRVEAVSTGIVDAARARIIATDASMQQRAYRRSEFS
ncbi:hypothetical protein [Cognatilysobacter bugurensis]|uniref:hypothetical protein n=1 Tax=Cognatilysobacter bugurensis TaxID=543356 RepID=UPI0016747E3C|nr:hypothetical protein [Lysobacter bugurensis]